MTELPRGTVTFLFTDVEGSTRLLRQLRDGYREVLNEHRRLLREAFEAHGGLEVEAQGDALFVVFARAHDAVAGAYAGQRALAEHPWAEGIGVRVRMGLHTGEPSVGEDGYLGLDVHRAARICAAAHGGQVLLSRVTAGLVEDEDIRRIELRDLGEQHLKDFDRPERLFQLVGPGLDTDFTELRVSQGKPLAELEQRADELAVAASTALVSDQKRPLRRPWLAATVVLALVAAAVGVTAIVREDRAPSLAEPNSVAIVDAETNTLVRTVPVGRAPGGIAVGAGSVWVANEGDSTVSRLNVRTGRLETTIGVGMKPRDIAVAATGVWVAGPSTLVRVDPYTSSVSIRIPIPVGAFKARHLASVTTGFGDVWFAQADRIWRVAPESGAVLATIATDDFTAALVPGLDAVWAQGVSGTITRIDPHTNAVAAKPSLVYGGEGDLSLGDLAVGAGSVWATQSSNDGTVWRIDLQSNLVLRSINVGRRPSGVVTTVDAVWVANSGDGTVSRIEPATNEVVATVEVGNAPIRIAYGAGKLWMTIQKS